MTIRYGPTLILLVITAWAVPSTLAQITITRADVESQIGESNSMASYSSSDVAALQAIVDAEGENQTYDFTDVSPSDTLFGTATYYAGPGNLPAADDYPTSNYNVALELGLQTGSPDSTVWIFNRIEDDAAYTLGGAYVLENPDTGEQDTLSFVYDPPQFNFPLPFTYGNDWSDTTNIFGIDTITESEVEGWGTLVTPMGSFDALRVRSTTTTDAFGFTEVSHSLEFFTKNNEVSAQIELDEDGTTAVSAEFVAWMLTTAAESDEIPRSVRLEQNYPNPFNPVTKFVYELDANDHVRLTVHDVLGRTVAVLVDDLLPAGRHAVSFDASDLSSGTYIYRLHSRAGMQTRTMTVAK